MLVLGLSFGYHDSGVALVEDGEVRSFASEERYSKNKNDASFPQKALAATLIDAGVRLDDIDAIIYYEDPWLKADRVGAMARQFAESREAYIEDVAKRWISEDRISPIDTIARRLRYPKDRIHFVEHHLSHAANAYYTSPFEEALVLTIDGVGEYETLSLWKGAGTKLTRLTSMKMPESIGLLYSTITAFCGFAVNEGEYKLMGLSAFGSSEQVDDIRDWTDLDSPAMKASAPGVTNTIVNSGLFSEDFIDRFGKPFTKGQDDHLDHRFTSMAASIQRLLEEKVCQFVSRELARHNMQNLCFGGGVALNCNLNGRLRRSVAPNLYVPAAPGDSGSAIGCALQHYYTVSKDVKKVSFPSPYLGRPVDTEYFENLKNVLGARFDIESVPEGEMPSLIAESLVSGNVVGHMFGRFEMGPRALGNRSILADPRSAEMQERINIKIKNREPFRPFAPAILGDRASEFFEIPPISELGVHAPEHFMLCTHYATAKGRECIPAAVHVDGTSRVQLVTEELNQRFYNIINEFDKRTNVPAIINTSLNVSGQPMASDVSSGLFAFLNSDLDLLFVDNLVVRKK